MKCLKVVGMVFAGIVVVATLYFAVGGCNVAVDDPHWGTTATLLTIIRERSIASCAGAIEAPRDLDNTTRVAQGAVSYAEMCAGCQPAPGVINTEFRDGLYPSPPDLVSDPIPDPKLAFWAIKHGVKMTGMAA